MGDECESLDEDNEEERRLVKETIGKDEMDALSVTSGVGGSDSEDNDSDEGASANEYDSNGGGNAKNRAPRRSRRKRFTFSTDLASGGDDSDDDEGDERSGRSSARLIPTWERWTLRILYVESAVGPRLTIESSQMSCSVMNPTTRQRAPKKEYTYNPRKAKPAKTRRKKASEYGDGVVLKKDAPPESGTTEVADRRASRKGKKEGEENSANDNNTKASRCDKKVGAPKKKNGQIEDRKKSSGSDHGDCGELKPEML